MKPKFAAAIILACTLVATGCQEKRAAATAAQVNNSVSLVSAPGSRFIAERHNLEITTPESQLQKAWDSAIAFCGTIQCEVISSSLTTRTDSFGPSGTMSLRVAPEDLSKLISEVQKFGTIARHSTEREDKTTAVVDNDAKIKNLTSFRDNLRAMLAKPSATVEDLVAIQKQLTDTQAELDSDTALQKMLANETQKVAVDISFRAEGSGGRSSGLAEVWSAFRESGAELADSTAALVATIATVIPWLILLVPVSWLLIKSWRWLRPLRNHAGPPR